MPPQNSIGEAVAKYWTLRKRVKEGFIASQMIRTLGFQSTPYIMGLFDVFSEMVKDMTIISPLRIPDTYDKIVKKVISDIDEELNKEKEGETKDLSDPHNRVYQAKTELTDQHMRAIEQLDKAQDTLSEKKNKKQIPTRATPSKDFYRK